MVMFIILHAVALMVLSIASITDIKTREVPDWLSYGLMIAGLGIRLLFTVATFDWFILIDGVVGFLVFIFLGYVMYYTGQWGGGDSKLLMGLGAVFGFTFGSFPILLLFLVNLLLAGGVYGIGWLVVLSIHHRVGVMKEIKRRLHVSRKHNLILVLATLLLIITLVFVAVGSIAFPALILLALFPLITFYLFIIVKSVERITLYKRILPVELTEGDWLTKNIVINGKRIAGPKDLGISKKQIKDLIHLYRKKKIGKITVKNGIPFVPSFLLGYILTLALGNWLMLLV